MRTKSILMVLCAALGGAMLPTQAHAKSDAMSWIPSQPSETFELPRDVADTLVLTKAGSVASPKAIAVKTLKRAWTSFKKFGSNMTGKRIKHEGKHNKAYISLQSVSGQKNLHEFLHKGPKTNHRPMGPPREAGAVPRRR